MELWRHFHPATPSTETIMIAETESEGIDLSEPSGPIDADGLYNELNVAIQCDMADWLVDAVVHAVCNNDLKFLQSQIVKHVPGWEIP
jgi:hypothetical protein